MSQKLAFAVPVLSVVLFVQPARAQPDAPPSDGDVCSDSYERAQEQMRPNQAESKLLKARESLRTCLRSSCKSWMVSDCSKWLSEVETRIPTVVFGAKDAKGQDVTAVRVTTASGTVLVEQLDGRAIELEPGQQDFVFTTADGMRAERHALVREGEKAQAVIATFAPRPGEAVPPPGPVDATVTPNEPPSPTLRYVGYGVGAAGIVGLGVGTILGLMTLSKKSNDCDADGLCAPGTRDSLSSTAAASTVAFVAGAALAGAGVALVLLAPKKTTGRVEARIDLGGITVGGRW